MRGADACIPWIDVRPPWLELRGQVNFCDLQPPRILDNTVINLQKGRKTFWRKITTSYKYFKIVKIVVYIFKHAKTFSVLRKHKVKKIKGEIPTLQ